MKYFILFIILINIFFIKADAQVVKQLHPVLGAFIDKSTEGKQEFLQQHELCELVWKKVQVESDYNNLSSEEKLIFDNCNEQDQGYWDVIGNECSWYCGGGLDTNSASSSLTTFNGIEYSASNIHDLNYKTAWIEGAPGYGKGEFIIFHFPPENPRITEIIIVNGYVKSYKAWKENSRVKALKMYVNDKLYAVLNLVDCRNEQHFEFEPLGYSDRENFEALRIQPWWTLKFEIADIYEGDKYDDTAITEIYFDGIDVH